MIWLAFAPVLLAMAMAPQTQREEWWRTVKLGVCQLPQFSINVCNNSKNIHTYY
jgi:hypothetical protein